MTRDRGTCAVQRRGALRRLSVGLVGWSLAFATVATALLVLPGANAQDLSPSSPLRERHQMISLVALSNSYAAFRADAVSEKLDEIYPGKFWPPEQQDNFVVGGPSPKPLLIKSTMPGRSGMFMLMSAPGRYTAFSDFARFIADPALRRKAEAQACWLSVDLVGKIGSNEDAYRFIAAALAKLAPADAAVLVKAETNTTIVFDDEVRRRLADGQLP
jgi:hypothetical protein